MCWSNLPNVSDIGHTDANNDTMSIVHVKLRKMDSTSVLSTLKFPNVLERNIFLIAIDIFVAPFKIFLQKLIFLSYFRDERDHLD